MDEKMVVIDNCSMVGVHLYTNLEYYLQMIIHLPHKFREV